ncbi:MAG: MBL fold metallo-hydrolase [Clostridia bacterium]|nr:MBL fold metallo-hydrolase [Clostridia bacterium]
MNRGRLKIVAAIGSSIIIVIVLTLVLQGIQEIQLTQLKANSNRQMMGYIIKTSTDKVIIVDGGTTEDAPNLINHINKLGGKVDVWFITYPHSDHAGAIEKVVQETEIPIEKIYYTANDIDWYIRYAPEGAYEAEHFYSTIQNERVKDNAEEVTLNQIIKIDFITCEVLGIKNPEITEDAFNNSSMVLKMDLPETSILFLGDTGAESGDKLLKYQSDKLKSDIVQVAHHGQDGAKESLYQAIQAKICLWPTPEWIWNNDLGEGENTGPFTTFETREWMEKLQVEQHIVEKDGDITITVK